jgi:hypothetical protein
MDPREQFVSEEFVQYAAECRRMARLGRKPSNSGKAMSSRSPDWITQRLRQFELRQLWLHRHMFAVSAVRR